MLPDTHTHQTPVVAGFACGGSRLQGKRKVVRRLSDSGSSNYPLFDMLECGPVWDYSPGGTKVLVAANGLDEKQVKEACSQVHVMFDRTEVRCSLLLQLALRLTVVML